MSNLPGNPHWGLHGDYASTGDGRVIGEALLALAYEQRTATLVQALLSDSLVTDGKYDEIQAEVRKRLGLGDNK